MVFFGIPWYFSVYRGISRDPTVSRGITLVSLWYRAGIDGFVDFDFSYFTFVFNFVQKGPSYPSGQRKAVMCPWCSIS